MKETLTASQIERLAKLVEECGEVIHMCGKILKHGYDSTHPDYDNISNRHNLELELGDLLAITDFMIKRGDISRSIIVEQRDSKTKNILQFMHHQWSTK